MNRRQLFAAGAIVPLGVLIPALVRGDYKDISAWQELTEHERQQFVDLFRSAWENGQRYPRRNP